MEVLHYNSAGNYQQTFFLQPDPNYTNSEFIIGMDLAIDQQTIYYSPIAFGQSVQSTVIKRFDVLNNQQLPDWNIIEGWSGDLELLPPGDGSGGLLIAQFSNVTRLDANGDTLKTYKVPIPPDDPAGVGYCNGAAGVQALVEVALDPDGTSFWTVDFCRANIFKINIESGEIEAGPINTGTGPNTVFGIGVRGKNNTETGTPTVELSSSTTPTTLNFSNVTEAGTTTLIPNAEVPNEPPGFELAGDSTVAAFEITTTAAFSGSVAVCIDYSPLGILTETEEMSLKLFHYEGNDWVDITKPGSPDTVNNRICGSVTSFSPFAIFKALTPEVITQGLVNQVKTLVSAGVLNNGQGNSLTTKLEGVLQKLNQGNTIAAINKLNGFINHVNSFIDEDVLIEEEAQPLIDGANAIIDQLNGVSKLVNRDKPETKVLPTVYALEQNYPNPFNPSTTISYQLPQLNNVELVIYNMAGQKVATLISEQQPAGIYQYEWDAGDLASGAYFYLLKANDPTNNRTSFSDMKKLILVK